LIGGSTPVPQQLEEKLTYKLKIIKFIVNHSLYQQR